MEFCTKTPPKNKKPVIKRKHELRPHAWVRDIIEQEGYTVVGEASNGNDAMEKYVQLQPNLVVMDITMQYVDGIEGLRNIKIIDPNAKIMFGYSGTKICIE